MKVTKNILLAALAAAGVWSWQSQTVAADQSGPGAGQRAAHVRERIMDRAGDLNLTDEQKAKLKPIWQERSHKLRELWQDQSLSQQEKVEKLKVMREEMAPKLKQLLTAEQLEKWQKESTLQDREGLRDALGKLNLTDEQKAKLRGLWQEQAQDVRDLRQDTNLSAKEKMEKFKAIQEAFEAKLKEMLTGEQFEAWQQKRATILGQARERWQKRGSQ